jgi:hypothetical protein
MTEDEKGEESRMVMREESRYDRDPRTREVLRRLLSIALEEGIG